MIKDDRDEFGRIISWLLGLEELAAEVYTKGAERFSGDKAFASFLVDLAEEERDHLKVMRRAEELSPDPGEATAIALSEETMSMVQGEFERCRGLLDSGGCTKDAFIGCIITTEYSEWNDLFHYVVNTVKRTHREFIPAVAAIEHHKRVIRDFLESDPALARHLERIEGLPVLWREKILVVDDSEAIVDVLAAVLEKEGSVVAASNGREALKRLEEGYFASVVSDVDMPVMDGMEFFKKAAELYPGIRDRFVFFTSRGGRDFTSFVEESGARLIRKPADIVTVRETVAEVLSQGRHLD